MYFMWKTCIYKIINIVAKIRKIEVFTHNIPYCIHTPLKEDGTMTKSKRQRTIKKQLIMLRPKRSKSPGSVLICLKAPLMSILYRSASEPNTLRRFTTVSTEGWFNSKNVFKYKSLLTPSLTDLPCGKLKSSITLLLLELGLSLVKKGDI